MADKKKKQQKQPAAEKKIPAEKKSAWMFLAPVLLLTFFVYSNTFKNYFIINWDDDGYIINNPLIKELSWKSILYMFSHFHLDNYHPLTTLSNALEYHFFKLNPKPYHFNNLLLHLLNTGLVFYFIRQLLKNKEAAMLVALLFAVHPMHVESVSWISERKDLLYTAFFMLSLIFYNRFLAEEKRSLLYLSLLWMLLSCLSKPAGIALTPLLFLLDDWAGKKINLKSLLAKIPFFILSFIFGGLALLSQSKAGSMNMVESFPLLDKVLFVFYGLSFYLVKMMVPIHLSSMYLYPERVDGLLPMAYYLAPLFIAALVFLIIRAKAFRKTLLFGFLFYLFTLAMVIQIVPVGKAIVAERYSYVPYIGLFFMIAQLYLKVKNNEMAQAQKIRPLLNGLLAVAILAFSVATFQRNKDWMDSNSLFSSYIKNNPDNYYGYFARGVGRSLQQDVQGSIADYTEAIKRDSTLEDLFYNRGVEYEKINKKAEAAQDYSDAIRANPRHFKSYYNRGNIKFMAGDLEGAVQDYQHTLEVDTTHAQAYCNRAIVSLKLGDTVASLRDLDASLQHDPDLLNALLNRATILANQNRFDLACKDYERAAALGNDASQKVFDYYCKPKP